MNSPSVPNESLDFRLNKLVEDIFKFTINKTTDPSNSKIRPQPLVFLEDSASASDKPFIDIGLLEHALFERLLVEDPSPLIVNRSKVMDIRLITTQCILYLFECYKDLSLHRAQSVNCDPEWTDILDRVIMLTSRNAATALKQPDLYCNQNIHSQVLNIFAAHNLSHPSELINFFKLVAADMREDDSDTFCSLMEPLLNILQQDVKQGSILILPSVAFSTLEAFSKIPEFALAVVKQSIPNNKQLGKAYAETLLGALFSISSLPNRPDDPDEYIDVNSLNSNGGVICKNLWNGIENLSMRLHRISLSFLKSSPEVRDYLLTWMGECIQYNTARKQVWGRMMQQYQQMTPVVSDGFVLNLCSVLLRLCEPFTKKINDPKLLKVDPTYCSVESVDDLNSKKVHLRTLHSETCIVPVEENEKRLVATGEFNFITECFFMAHSALELGVKPCFDRLMNLIQAAGRMQELLRTDHHDIRNMFEESMKSHLIKCYSLRTALLEPSFMDSMGAFHRATCTWLVQLVLDPDPSIERDNFAPGTYRNFVTPVTNPPATLKCVPELVFENLCSYLLLLRRFNSQGIEEKGLEFLEPVLTTLIVFMGSNKLIRNPHLRAKLAECIDCLLPTQADMEMPDLAGGFAVPNYFYRTQLFKEHPHRHKIIPSLLDVFVGIEMTGESVQFEQKFNYRRPMYKVMDYLWTLDEQKEVFKNLASEAEQNMEAVNPPLFLRFINILMNDAIFLLDEALTNMAQLRQMQHARDNREWDSLPSNEREQNIQQAAHIGMIARFDNILGMNTINTLQYLTEEIQSIFCHSTMVDRIAAMLNYFLLHLVGPKKKNLKVKDMNEYKFDPATIVRKICAIYVHLGSSDLFCAAVSRDGRSYSPQLFQQATDVLVRIHGIELLHDLENVSKRVAELASQQMTEEEMLTEAPDEFLDPIMSTLMTDPVILPSSRKTVDRSTIARHLLSDQTDPFNRAPLTMDMVQADVELKRKIEEWISDKKSSCNNV